MMLSLYYFVFWVMMRGADSVRPSALHRGYAFIWLYAITWVILVGVTVLQDRFRIASGYPFVFLHAATFLCLLISLCELFALPSKTNFSTVNAAAGASHEDASDRGSLHSPRPRSADDPHTAQENEEPENADERTPLIARSTSRDSNVRTTFATGYRRSLASIASEPQPQPGARAPFQHEQAWSADLPTWTWLPQLLLMGPVPIWLFGQLGLFLTAAVSGTGADGSSLLFPYALVAALGALTLVPLTPFLHRVPYHLPLLVLAALTGSLVYCLVAFPFSTGNQYKVFFQQSLDLETGASTVTFEGIDGFVRPVVAAMPSAAGKEVECDATSRRPGLSSCRYDGSSVLPNIGPSSEGLSLGERFSGLVSVNGTRDTGRRRATLEINAVDTKACFVSFDKGITKFEIQGGSEWDPRFGGAEDGGVCQLRLWRRDWDTPWRVDVEWEDDGSFAGGDGDGGLGGEVECMWADANERGTIPALDEALQYAPVWVAVTKLAEGLVVGKKGFRV
ncbi:hypothetical protein IMZ48_01720 [Candidatus Bathyarchaeota archaeon]|nr:hypothetical protein [Candidatus Bathyarchaeota archaeon]